MEIYPNAEINQISPLELCCSVKSEIKSAYIHKTITFKRYSFKVRPSHVNFLKNEYSLRIAGNKFSELKPSSGV